MTADDGTIEYVGDRQGDETDETKLRRQSSQPAMPQSWHGRLFTLCRTLGLRILPASINSPEQSKVAFQQDRMNALIHCSIHIAPLAGALVLIYLNLSWHYVGPDIPSESVTALQFAAKLHEMMMVASLAAVFASYIRRLLVSSGGLPFGIAFAHLQIQQLPYLWSPDLWGALVSRSYPLAFKMQFAAVIVFTGSLISTVGPASAACMIPRAGLWLPVEFSMCMATTTDEMFPTDPRPASYNHGDCTTNPYFQTARHPRNTEKACTWYGSQRSDSSFSALGGTVSNLTSSAPWSLSQMEIDLCERLHADCSEIATNSEWSTTGLWYSPEVNAPLTLSLDLDIKHSINVRARTSIPNRSLASLLSFSGDESRISEITNGMDAFSNVHCLAQNSVIWHPGSGSLQLNFSTGEETTDSAVRFVATNQEKMEQGLLRDEKPYNEMLLLHLPGKHGYGFVWAYSGFAGYPYDKQNMNRTRRMHLTPCTFETGWTPTSLQLISGTVSSQSPPENARSISRSVHAQRDWLELSNPELITVDNDTATAFNYLQSQYRFPFANTASSAATSLSTLLTLSLTTVSPYLSGGSGVFLSNGACDGYNKYSFQVSQKSYAVGRGYGPDVLTIQISLAILMLYSIIALTHCLYSAWSGVYSSAWDAVSDVIALTINSRPAPELQNTCAGVRKMHVFANPVRIATTRDKDEDGHSDTDSMRSESPPQHLELVFPSVDALAVSNVQTNTEYGAIKVKCD